MKKVLTVNLIGFDNGVPYNFYTSKEVHNGNFLGYKKVSIIAPNELVHGFILKDKTFFAILESEKNRLFDITEFRNVLREYQSVKGFGYIMDDNIFMDLIIQYISKFINKSIT